MRLLYNFLLLLCLGSFMPEKKQHAFYVNGYARGTTTTAIVVHLANQALYNHTIANWKPAYDC